jgi:hypothetical protein
MSLKWQLCLYTGSWIIFQKVTIKDLFCMFTFLYECIRLSLLYSKLHLPNNSSRAYDRCSFWIMLIELIFMPPWRRVGGHINLPLSVRLSVCPSRYRYMVCSAISSYSFGATALIFRRMFIHIMEVCMSTGFWFSSNILKMTGSWT